MANTDLTNYNHKSYVLTCLCHESWHTKRFIPFFYLNPVIERLSFHSTLPLQRQCFASVLRRRSNGDSVQSLRRFKRLILPQFICVVIRRYVLPRLRNKHINDCLPGDISTQAVLKQSTYEIFEAFFNFFKKNPFLGQILGGLNRNIYRGG